MTNNWKVVKLADITCYVNRGIPPVYTQDNSGTAVINQKCIRDGQINFDYSRLTDESARQVPQNKLVQPYDILVNSTGTGTVGRVGQVIDLTQRSTVDSHVTIVRPNKDQVDPVYLGIWLKSKQKELEDLAEGSSNQVELSRDKISSIKVILPTLKAQQKIAAILTSIDEQINKTDQIIHKAEVLKQGLIQKLLTKGIGHNKLKKTIIGEIPESWEIKTLQSISEQIVGGGTPSRKVPEYWNGSIPWATVKDLDEEIIELNCTQETITERGLERSSSKIIPKHNIVTSTRMGIGRFYINSIDVAINQDLKGIILNKNVYTPFVLWTLIANKEFLEQKGTGTTVKGIKVDALKDLLLPIPSFIEQQQIAEEFSDIYERIQINKRIKDKLTILKNGLMQDIFTQKVTIN